MATIDPAKLAHLEWLGYVQPTGLVVSPTALVTAGAILSQTVTDTQRRLHSCLVESDEPGAIRDFSEFATSVLGWSFRAAGYAGTPERPIPDDLAVVLPETGETFRPDFAVVERDPADGASPWQLVVALAEEPLERSDAPTRVERLLRQHGIPAGLVCDGTTMRLVSAPRGESSGWIDFKVAEMATTAGRAILAALRLLLGEDRLLSLPPNQRLAALLADSRAYQNEVSERLAQQVLHALYELLRGFQAAHDRSGGELLRQPLAEHPDIVYRALLTVVLRLVFLLYAEERDMLPSGEVFEQSYSLAGLHARLREDAALYPDTMEQRFGAWAQLLVLFRLIYDGATTDGIELPRRHGVLFDPDRFPFLEGRVDVGARQIHERIEPPLVPDGVVYRALENLLVLDGERISYRALDVEQIGSVYETMMGFRLETATGRSIAIKAAKAHGAPTTIDLDDLLTTPAAKREKRILDLANRKLPERTKKLVVAATTLDDLHAALDGVIDSGATPDIVPHGAMILQPSDERRRSGSHYTPRSLTEPIVRTTLEPILADLSGSNGRPPTPEQILDLKVCDPAMGSGAFLVETCRQLAEALIDSWDAHDARPSIPPDEDEVIYARRLIAQRCLYGVDRNPVAVDLAKVSLWLVTLARDHAFTFVDHALRHGDSLVGLTTRQIEAFHWDTGSPIFTAGIETTRVRDHVERISELRELMRDPDETVTDYELRSLWEDAEIELRTVRLLGDLVTDAYFSGTKPAHRKATRDRYAADVANGTAERHLDELATKRDTNPPLVPFHWELEFPEVFQRDVPGFDVFVGNPPFAGKNTTIAGNVDGYLDWLKHLHAESHGNADLVAHFFRRAFDLLRTGGASGLIATNTIAQGDTRSTGLRWICTHGGSIFAARRRVKWPLRGAAVVVSVVHVRRACGDRPAVLDGREVASITAYLVDRGASEDPAPLAANAGRAFQGSILLGIGFTFDDTDTTGAANSLADMRRLIDEDASNGDAIFPYIGGEEINNHPCVQHHRYAIDFFDRTEEDCWSRWPQLMAIVEERVRPIRRDQKRDALRDRWWQYAEKRPGLKRAVANLPRVLAVSQTSRTVAFAFLPAGMVYSHKTVVFPVTTYAAFASLQSRPHDTWVRFFGSTMKDDAVYTPSDCFTTYPFVDNWIGRDDLEQVGDAYYHYRARLMKMNNEGMTQTYNRFHDPEEHAPEIAELRRLHAVMDRAVLDAYGWRDVEVNCEFLLDYELDDADASSRRKKPYRYRWPDDVRDEVLARLLALNGERAAAEKRAGAEAPIGADDDGEDAGANDDAPDGGTLF